LDKNYTVFGYVVEGMDVVDQINSVPTDKREWPIDNIRMKVSVIDEF
jgi:cyclophilin family peptidyl-prolyl cis-trans isomerase